MTSVEAYEFIQTALMEEAPELLPSLIRFRENTPLVDEKKIADFVKAHQELLETALAVELVVNEACADSREKSMTIAYIQNIVKWSNVLVALNKRDEYGKLDTQGRTGKNVPVE